MKQLKLSAPWYSEAEVAAATRVLRSQVTNMGHETHLFEKELKKFLGRDDIFVITTNSCTAALIIALQAANVKPQDEVIVPTLTFVSTFQAVAALGAIPVPCDITDSCVIDPQDAASRITHKTKAIVPVAYAGLDNTFSEIYALARRHNLTVIEDAAHSFGDQNIIKRAGTLCFSFDPIKNLSCTDGGAIVCADKNMAKRMEDLRLLGVIGDTERRVNNQRSWDFDVAEQGWRMHMGNLCAAIGRAQLARFDEIAERRQRYAQMYAESLSSIKNIKLLPINYKTAVPHIFPIIVEDRDALKAYLISNGIACGTQYKPNHLLSFFNLGYSLPNAERLYSQLLSIPLHPLLTDDDVLFIITTIKSFFN